MNIKELKEVLKDLPDDMEVILQKDSEGNGYSPAAGADPNAVYIKECEWCGPAELYEGKEKFCEDCGGIKHSEERKEAHDE